MSGYGPRWAKTRRMWFRENHPDSDGNYECTYCGKPLPLDEVTLDHIVRIEDMPELKYQLNNLRPLHSICNSKADRLLKDIHYFVRVRKGRNDEHIEKFIAETQAVYKHFEFMFKLKADRQKHNTK